MLESFQEIYVYISKGYKTQSLEYIPKIEVVNPVKFIFPPGDIYLHSRESEPREHPPFFLSRICLLLGD